MSYKDLAIDYDAMCAHFFGIAKEGTFQKINKGNEQLVFEVEDKQIKVLVYRKKGGLITLVPGGANQELCSNLIGEMLENIKKAKEKNFSFQPRNVPRESFVGLIQYLNEVIGAKIVQSCENGDDVIFKMQGCSGDVLTFTHYKNGTLLIQGRPINLIVEVTAFLYEEGIITEAEANYAYSFACGCALPSKGQGDASVIYPVAHAFFDSKLKKTLNTAVYMLGVDLPVEDPSIYCFPALRLLEGFVKALIFAKTKRAVFDFGDGLFKANDSRSKYVLTADWQADIGCSGTCRAIEDAYSYYRSHRHSLFHADPHPGLTKIPNRLDAIKVATTALGIIEQHLSNLKV